MAMIGERKRKLDSVDRDESEDDSMRTKCYKCGGRGHLQKDCTVVTGDGFNCYKCGGKGHFARECPSLSRDICYFCGIMGHHGMDCPLILRAFGTMVPSKRKEVLHRLSSLSPQFAQQSNALVQYAQQNMHDPQYGHVAQPYAYTAMGVGGVGVQGVDNGTTSGLLGGMQPSSSDLLQQYLSLGLVNNRLADYSTMTASSYDPTGAAAAAAAAAATTANPYGDEATAAYNAAIAAASASMHPVTHGGHHSASGVCYRCGQPGHIARTCMNVAATEMMCFRCGVAGHIAKDCPNPPTSSTQSSLPGGHSGEACFRCGELGHFSRDCTKNGATPSRDACFKCGQPGHKTRDCRGPDIRVCFLCKGTGHVARDCTVRGVKA